MDRERTICLFNKVLPTGPSAVAANFTNHGDGFNGAKIHSMQRIEKVTPSWLLDGIVLRGLEGSFLGPLAHEGPGHIRKPGSEDCSLAGVVATRDGMSICQNRTFSHQQPTKHFQPISWRVQLLTFHFDFECQRTANGAATLRRCPMDVEYSRVTKRVDSIL